MARWEHHREERLWGVGLGNRVRKLLAVNAMSKIGCTEC
jgi:hypothetical protein